MYNKMKKVLALCAMLFYFLYSLGLISIAGNRNPCTYHFPPGQSFYMGVFDPDACLIIMNGKISKIIMPRYSY